MGDQMREDNPPPFRANSLKGIGFALVVSGLSVIAGVLVVALCEHEAATAIERVLKWALLAAAVGFVFVFVSVVKQKRAAAKSDKYEDVEK